MFVGLENYIFGIEQHGIVERTWAVCSHYPGCSMCAWFMPGEYMVDKTDLYALSVCHGCAVTDGNVHFVQDCKYAQTQYPMGLIFIYLGFGAGAGGVYFTDL